MGKICVRCNVDKELSAFKLKDSGRLATCEVCLAGQRARQKATGRPPSNDQDNGHPANEVMGLNPGYLKLIRNPIMRFNKSDVISRFADVREPGRSTKEDKEKLDNDVEQFLANGGEIQEIPDGVGSEYTRTARDFYINKSVGLPKRSTTK